MDIEVEDAGSVSFSELSDQTFHLVFVVATTGYGREQDDELAQSWLKRVATMNDTSAHAWTDGVPYHILGKFKLGVGEVIISLMRMPQRSQASIEQDRSAVFNSQLS